MATQTSMRVFTKTFSSGSGKGVVLGPRSMFHRKMPIPGDWKRVRIAAIYGFTNLVDDNGSYSALGITDVSLAANQWHFGLSNGVVGIPGDGTTGIRFIGHSTLSNVGNLYQGANRSLGTNSSTAPTTHTIKGVSFAANSTVENSTAASWGLTCDITDATAATAFAAAIVSDISLVSSISLTTYCEGTSNLAVNKVSELGLMGLLGGGTTNGYSITGITNSWWDLTSTNPVGLQHIYIHHPMLHTRMILYGYGCMQLA